MVAAVHTNNSNLALIVTLFQAGHSYLQYLIACSMLIRQRKAWEIWSHVMMTEGRHTVAVHLFRVNSSPWVVNNEQDRLPSNALTSRLLMDRTTKGIEILHWAPPPVCLPSVYLMAPHVTRSPSSPPPPRVICLLQILVVGMTWVRGYPNSGNMLADDCSHYPIPYNNTQACSVHAWSAEVQHGGRTRSRALSFCMT